MAVFLSGFPTKLYVNVSCVLNFLPFTPRHMRITW
jgi:hypothetical protein